MKEDKRDQDMDLSSIPGEFRENYRFLCELIDCRDKNHSATDRLDRLFEKSISHMKNKLNRRQLKILNDFFCALEEDADVGFEPPVPEELEASIRIRKRATWLPWEAEAIRKIERWRSDVVVIDRQIARGLVMQPAVASLSGLAGRSR
jgi:hypothetical protein